MGIQLPYDTCIKETHEPTAVLEALLFLSGQPMKISEICTHTGWTAEEADAIAEKLTTMLAAPQSGLTLLRVAGGYQLVTKAELHDTVHWVRTGTMELTSMALEVLAIVAFKQPVTRAEIEKLRGVSSERILSSLVQQGLVIDLGRKDSPGRPILYGTSVYFLECIGMDSLDELAGHIPESQTAAETDPKEVNTVAVEAATEDIPTEETNGQITESHE
ncbi:MAG: SMC-Scp complex subunit ScpB [Megasphaera sp.]|jgi:segregation and condensation protein B|nr:SMC-Scp complex subunit ScpB [Megasphaera sp.]MCH4187086.1 SMC-Scp complex subunit ScpB [Megasphaera sp.]MCH4216978.1 SMC-Scp complex subunit ScpB [Megasphaera sp.]